MLYYIDPFTATALISGGIFFVSYMLGKWKGEGEHEKTIAYTIDHLIDEGFIKTKRLPNGEVEMIPFRNRK
tara:strand:- start:6950 stop:7162 length:213 start_codon:yes stop_codon:yes gene_type:complete